MSVANRNMKVGDELPPLTKEAKVPPGDYPWGSPHNKEYAKSLGYSGALVPGVASLAYMAECLRRFFGKGWIVGGKVDVSFIGGVVDGEKVMVKGIIKDEQAENSKIRLVLDVWIENEAGQKVVVGSASGLVS